MSGVGGDITELLRRLGADALVHELERAGCAPRVLRAKCPWPKCEHKGKDRKRTAVVFSGGHPRVGCYVCDQKGDLVDLLQQTRGLTAAEAMAHVQGQPAPERPRPVLHVVTPVGGDDTGKLLPAEVERLWNALAESSELGLQYLDKRGLSAAVDAKLVRFVNGDSTNKEFSSLARRDYRIAALLSDVVGQPRGIQVRRSNDAPGDAPKILSVKNSVTSRAFFGAPGLIEVEPVIAVAEGMADTLALQLWAEKRVVVVGAAGKGFVRRLAEELEAAGVDVTGKLFALFPQNDDPRDLKSTSRAEFKNLAKMLQKRGAHVVMVPTPKEYGDIADWRRARPEEQWPPPELAKVFTEEPGDDTEPVVVLPAGVALPMLKQVDAKTYAQNYTTLVSLLDDEASRVGILNTYDELTWCEMTQQVKVGGRELNPRDLSTVRLGLETQARSTDGKPLQFKKGDIEEALAYVAGRKPVHAIKDWVRGLAPFDGHARLETELPGILGHAAGSFEGRLLRRWFVSLLARAMEPGCQVDTVLILTGGQGAKKTTFFRTLGGKWTTSSKVEPGDVEGMMVMRLFWIIEWGELSSMKARSREVTKDFITNPVDTFRSPYARGPASAPRHSVLVGTTNDKHILEDPTGNRRYWPVEVLTEKIDVGWLDRNREQLFAEALALYNGGLGCSACAADPDKRCGEHRWWLTDEEELLLKQHQGDFEVDDHPWFDVVADWIEKTEPTHLTTAQILQYGVDQKVGDFKSISTNQVSAIMDRLGWRSTREGTGSRKRVWVRKGALL